MIVDVVDWEKDKGAKIFMVPDPNGDYEQIGDIFKSRKRT